MHFIHSDSYACSGSYARARPHIPRYPSGQRTPWAPSTLTPAAGGGLRRTLARARRLRGTSEDALLQIRDLLASRHGIIDDRPPPPERG